MTQNLTNKELFKDAAWHYSRFRPGYPKEFFDYVISYFTLDGKGRLFDLGCGTGQVIFPLAEYFEEVIGLDPDEGMLEEAKIISEEKGLKNIRWMKGRAEDITSEMGLFRLITMGASFHWMEQEKVLQKAYEILEQNGGLVVVSGSSSVWRNPEKSEWKEACKKVIKKYLGENRRAGNSFYAEPKRRFEEIFADSQLRNFERWVYAYERKWTIDGIIGLLYTTSFASKRFFGDNAEAFENDLKNELLKLNPSGEFNEKIQVEAFLAHKSGI